MSSAVPIREFPAELLESSDEDRLLWFRKKLFLHPNLQKVSDDLAKIESIPEGINIVLLFGPAGAGKTCVAERTVEKILAQVYGNPSTSIGSIPAIYTKLWAPERGIFDWNDNYKRIGRSIHDVLLDKKIRYDIQEVIEDGKRVLKKSGPIPDTRNGILESLRQRGTKRIFLDEAQRLLKMPKNRRLVDQMDILQAFGAECNALIVLVGTYDLLNIAMLSDQLDRRTVEISFARYDCDNSTVDKEAYQTTLLSMTRSIPVEGVPDLLSEWYYFYSRTLGCIGSLKVWLYRAIEATLKSENRHELTVETIKKLQTSAKNLNVRLNRILEGEALIAQRDSEAELNQLYAKLKTPKGQGSGSLEQNNPPNALTKPSKPGTPKPQRYPVGGSND